MEKGGTRRIHERKVSGSCNLNEVSVKFGSGRGAKGGRLESVVTP